MASRLDKLSDRKAKSRLAPGRHSDGGGLYLNVTETGAKSWLFMWKVAGKRREMGLGSFNSVPLARARELAERGRQDVAAGRDPIAMRDAVEAKTFGQVADELIASMSPNWRNAKHHAQWKMTLGEYAETLWDMPVEAVDTAAVLSVLQPIWREKAETASRLRGRIEAVLDAARAHGHIPRNEANPARWRGHLDKLLPKRQKLTRGHHAAMPYAEVPAFIARLREQDSTAAAALEFTILTAARSGEVLGTTWQEINLGARLWVVPAARMKGRPRTSSSPF